MKCFDFDIKNGIFLHFLAMLKAKISCNGLHYTPPSFPSSQQSNIPFPTQNTAADVHINRVDINITGRILIV